MKVISAFVLGSLFVAVVGLTAGTSADENRPHKEKDKIHKEELDKVADPSYLGVCSGCHFAYQPGLLPSGSWSKILSNLDDHFGQPVDVDSDSLSQLRKYLAANAADTSHSKRSAKIMRSLSGELPMRITDVPYIRHKHHEITSAILSRKSVGSLSNCTACHRTAEDGNYDDDLVRIPE